MGQMPGGFADRAVPPAGDQQVGSQGRRGGQGAGELAGLVDAEAGEQVEPGRAE